MEGARFIIDCGSQMSLGHNTVATGVVYFHRFYMVHSFRSFPRYVTACCCLFLAGKVEETPKKCKDIIKTAKGLLSDVKFQSFGDDPKEEVMTLERILLQTIKFDLQVDHPYGFLVKYAKSLKGDNGKLQKMVQMAWNFVNDSLSTTVCLQWEPEVIGIALIHLASKLSKFTVSDWIGRQSHHLRWWDMFVADVEMEVLEDICHQVLDLYQQAQANSAQAPESPPQLPPSKCSPPVRRANNNQGDLGKGGSVQGMPIKSMDEVKREASMGNNSVSIQTVTAINHKQPQLSMDPHAMHYPAYGAMYAGAPPPQPVYGGGGGIPPAQPPPPVTNPMYSGHSSYPPAGHYNNGPPQPPSAAAGYYPPAHSSYYPPP